MPRSRSLLFRYLTGIDQTRWVDINAAVLAHGRFWHGAREAFFLRPAPNCVLSSRQGRAICNISGERRFCVIAVVHGEKDERARSEPGLENYIPILPMRESSIPPPRARKRMIGLVNHCRSISSRSLGEEKKWLFLTNFRGTRPSLFNKGKRPFSTILMEFTLKKRESRFIKGNLFITELFGNGKKGNNVSFFFFFFTVTK